MISLPKCLIVIKIIVCMYPSLNGVRNLRYSVELSKWRLLTIISAKCVHLLLGHVYQKVDCWHFKSNILDAKFKNSSNIKSNSNKILLLRKEKKDELYLLRFEFKIKYILFNLICLDYNILRRLLGLFL